MHRCQLYIVPYHVCTLSECLTKVSKNPVMEKMRFLRRNVNTPRKRQTFYYNVNHLTSAFYRGYCSMLIRANLIQYVKTGLRNVLATHWKLMMPMA